MRTPKHELFSVLTKAMSKFFRDRPKLEMTNEDLRDVLIVLLAGCGVDDEHVLVPLAQNLLREIE